MAGIPILLVDDNPSNVRLVSFILSAAGFEVRSACDARQAWEQLDGFLPRLILMDLQLPGTDGFQLTRMLKADPRTGAIPVVALTASVMKGDEDRARAAGCDGFVSKPIDTVALPAIVATYLMPSPARPGGSDR